MTRTFVVLPTYDEAENLPLIVPEILAQSEELSVLVVDDDSPDGTGKLADELAQGEHRQLVGQGPQGRCDFRHTFYFDAASAGL